MWRIRFAWQSNLGPLVKSKLGPRDDGDFNDDGGYDDYDYDYDDDDDNDGNGD